MKGIVLVVEVVDGAGQCSCGDKERNKKGLAVYDGTHWGTQGGKGFM